MTRLLTRNFIAFGFAAALAVSVAACDPRVANRGNIPDIDRIELLKPGETTKNEVAQYLGSPSSINMFGQETWLYVGETTETLAFFEREVTERSVLVVTFDEKGTVADVSSHGMDQARDVDPIERKTPTVGKKMTVLDQLVGNLNRYRGGRK